MRATTTDVLQLAQMYVARGYNRTGWRKGYDCGCGHTDEIIDTSRWAEVDLTSLCGAVTLACMDIFGDWYSKPQYAEAIKILIKASRAWDFDALVSKEFNTGTQDWALGVLEEALV